MTSNTTASSSSTSSTIQQQQPPIVDDEMVILELLAPDGYYRYLGVTKPPPESLVASSSSVSSGKASSSTDKSTTSTTDSTNAEKGSNKEFIDTVKKNYRKLSLKHHPDKSTGNVDTFRLLNRAQRVLLDTKLRTQYDLLGLDLDDDEIDNNTDSGTTNTSNDNNDRDNNKDQQSNNSNNTSSQGIIQEIASNILAAVLQLGVRTILMGVVSVIVVRYWFTLYPAYIFLLYTLYRMIATAGASIYDTIPTTCIAIGLFMMNRGYNTGLISSSFTWNTQFWIGESFVIGLFIYNSFSDNTIIKSLKPMIVWGVITIVSLILGLWFRGNVWNYCIVIVIIVIVAVLIAMAFPIMEIIVESILSDKLRKVGDKVRYHHQMIHEYYEKKYNIQR